MTERYETQESPMNDKMLVEFLRKNPEILAAMQAEHAEVASAWEKDGFSTPDMYVDTGWQTVFIAAKPTETNSRFDRSIPVEFRVAFDDITCDFTVPPESRGTNWPIAADRAGSGMLDDVYDLSWGPGNDPVWDVLREKFGDHLTVWIGGYTDMYRDRKLQSDEATFVAYEFSAVAGVAERLMAYEKRSKVDKAQGEAIEIEAAAHDAGDKVRRGLFRTAARP